MFQTILAPTDFSKTSRHALDIAVGIALLDQGQIHLLHVIETIPHLMFEELRSFYTSLEAHAGQELENLQALYRNRRVKIELHILYGNRVQEILKFTDNHQIDLIVMNSHKVDLNNPTHGWGTISYKVSALSQCPILLVK
jgi:universal stress protein A